MASFHCLRDARLRMMPLPPTIDFQRNLEETDPHNDNAHEAFTMQHIHPSIFPMVLGRIHPMEGNRSMQDSWQERHLEHYQHILEEIHECESKVLELRLKLFQDDLGFSLIQDIEDWISTSDDDSSEKWHTAHDTSSSLLSDDDTSLYSSSSSLETEPPVLLPEIPTSVLGRELAPLISDRHTFDNLAATCKELQNACETMIQLPPWPEGIIRLGVGMWSIAFSPDGKLLAAGGRDGSIRLLDRRKGVLPPLLAHIARVYSIVFHPNGRVMASGSGDGDVRIWNLKDLDEEPTRLETNSPHVDCLAFNHNGSILASSGDGRIRLWNISNHQCLADITDGSRVVESISFSPDGKTIAAGNWVGRVCLWDVQTRRRTAVLPESTCVHSVCYSADSTHLCSASDSNTVRLWDVADQSYTPLEGHQDTIWCVAFSPDGTRIASGSDDGTMRLFDTASGRCRAIFNGHDADATVYGVAFSPCNSFVASAGDDGCIELTRYS